MSKNVAMFVDVANMYYAARGQDVDVDYVALLKHATKGRDLIRAYAYTGLDPENENQRKFIDFLGKNGYKPVIKDIRKFGDGRMKANLDIELVVDLFRLADRMDIAVIVSGDGDFAPAIKALQDKGVRCEVISFKPNTSSDLIAVADEFMDIMKVASISRKEGRAVRDSMSAPEMPAKEVTPEFGFREASPSVAAAALAALKGGGSDGARRGRGGTNRRPAAAPAVSPTSTSDAPAAADPGDERVIPSTTAADPAVDADPEARRRRRRRGGRGRGRTRREDETTPAASESGDEEIGWQEFDDLSQLDGNTEDREFTFEEADAATLAELGLSSEDAAALEIPPTEATSEEAPKPARRRSTRTKKDEPPAAESESAEAAKPARRRSTRATRDEAPSDPSSETSPDASSEEAPKPGRRRTTRAKADEGSPTDAQSAKKPARSRSTRAKADDAGTGGDASAPEGQGDGEPQGIWGRFRTARKPRGTSSN
ncbi:MAG: NYN domain-containing protein [Candidatus Limnocylindria bacterium]